MDEEAVRPPTINLMLKIHIADTRVDLWVDPRPLSGYGDREALMECAIDISAVVPSTFSYVYPVAVIRRPHRDK